MEKIRIFLISLCSCFCAFFLFCLAIYIQDIWSFVPIKSVPEKLTLVVYKDFVENKPVITLKHYIDDKCIDIYELEIKNGVHTQENQVYEFPKLEDGRIECNIKLGDKYNSSFVIEYNQTEDLLQSGLLIYLTKDIKTTTEIDGFVYSDNYIYLVSENEIKTYIQKAGISEWSLVNDFPSLKSVQKNPKEPYIAPNYSNWKENEWKKIQVE